MQKNFDLRVSNIKAQCHAILDNFLQQPRDQVSSSTSDMRWTVTTEEDGVNLKNVGSTFGLVSGDNPA